jgi:hypothetical protein
MLLPDKHITFSESLLGFGSFLLSKLQGPMTADQLWRSYERDANSYPAYQSFDNMILALNVLYAIGALHINEYGELVSCRSDSSQCA